MDAFILQLYDCNIIQFGSFTLKTGVISPIYIDFRQVMSNPDLLELCVNALCEKVKQLRGTMVIGVPYGGIVYSTLVSAKLHMPHTLIRKEKKEYGGKKLIEGVLPQSDRCIIIEDVITTGTSVVNTINKIKGSCKDAIMEDIVCLLDRRPNGCSKVTSHLKIHSLFSIYELLECLYSHEKISNETLGNVLSFLNKQSDFSSKEFFTKNIETKNPITIKSYNAIFDENSSIMGIDARSLYDPVILFKYLQKNGHHFKYVIIDSELWNQFSLQHAAVLRKLADHFHFFIIDAIDIHSNHKANIKQKLCGGMYQRNTWVDMITTQEFTPVMGETLEEVNATSIRKIYYLPSVKTSHSYSTALTYKHICGGMLVNRRESWMKYSGIFYFSYYELSDVNKKAIQQKIYIDNCDFIILSDLQIKDKDLETLKSLTKVGIKNKC